VARLLSPAGRLLGALALLIAWLSVQAQLDSESLAALGARTLAARLLLCYVAAFWLRLGWQGLAHWLAARAPDE
jgi:hypothetical protein